MDILLAQHFLHQWTRHTAINRDYFLILAYERAREQLADDLQNSAAVFALANNPQRAAYFEYWASRAETMTPASLS